MPLTVSRLDLSIDLDAAVSRNHVVGNWDTLVDGDSLVDNGVVLHAGNCQLYNFTGAVEYFTYLDMLSILSILVIPSQWRICCVTVSKP